MRFEKSVEEKFTVVKLLEEKLDSRISPTLKAEFVNLHALGTKNLILNLSEVKYVDSSGLSAILAANRLCMGEEGVLVIAHVNPHVAKLIEISHLNTVLDILPTETEAREFVFMRELEKEVSGEEASSSAES
ncbi:MAG: anti-sigma factor antagonist [Bacteroidetes bacterium]|nr:MAG: anti-sigma factor antagonist [Bacteroidota bacterium]